MIGEVRTRYATLIEMSECPGEGPDTTGQGRAIGPETGATTLGRPVAYTVLLSPSANQFRWFASRSICGVRGSKSAKFGLSGAEDIVCGGGRGGTSIPSDRPSAGCLKARQRSGASSPEQSERSERARTGEGGRSRGFRYAHLTNRPARGPSDPCCAVSCLLRHLSGSAALHAGGTGHDAPKSGDRA